LGTRFHEVMEKIYQNISFKTFTLDELLVFYKDIWNKKYHNEINLSTTYADIQINLNEVDSIVLIGKILT